MIRRKIYQQKERDMENLSVQPIQGHNWNEGNKGLKVDEMSTETELIKTAQGNLAAFEPLYLRYYTRVYRYLRVRVNSDDDAADLTQQVFLKALDALPSYQFRGVPFAAWLFRIAHHTATDAYRWHKSTVSWDALPEVMSLQDLEADALHREEIQHLKDLVSRLKPDKRELLALRYAAELSAPEIAVIVGKSSAAIKKQLTRLLHTLKEQYHEPDEQ